MRKAFLVVLDYEENEEAMFTDVGVEVTFDNQLYELKERGFVASYEDSVAYELDEKTAEKIIKDLDAEEE